MSYQVKQGNIFGRVGEGIGKGLGEQLPKEMENYRLKSGLQELQKEAGNLDPLEFATKAYGTYAITPQMVQSLGELARSKQIENSLKPKGREENPFISKNELTQEKPSTPSITTRAPIEATLKNELAPTLEDYQSEAGRLIQERPDYYAGRPELAMADAEKKYNLARQRNIDLQTRRQNEQQVQNKVISGLQERADRLGATGLVPGNVYSEVEQKAISSILPKSEGGEGLTEEEAKNKYGKELDAIAKDYQAIKTVGGRDVLSKNPEVNKKNLEEIRQGFKKRDDLENFAKSLQAAQNISPSKSYYLAFKPSDIKELNNALVKLPELKKEKVPYSTTKAVNPEIARESTFKYAPELFKAMGTEGSPLAIYEELNARGYDGEAWMDYVSKNSKKLTEVQANQLKEPRGRLPTLDDAWLFYFSGLEKLLEQ